jgi:transposase
MGREEKDSNSSTRFTKRNTYSGTFKAKVVLELLRGRRSLNELAHDYNLHPNQIKNWKSRLLRQASYVLEDKRRKKRASDNA